MDKTFIIAEIGTSHGGNIDKAKRLIDASKEAGADCAKFQVVIADEIIHPNTGLVNLPGGATPLYDVFKSLEQPVSFYNELKKYTESIDMDFLASPFGIKSARLLKDIGSKQYKVASPELNHIPLLKELSTYNSPLIISTGVSKLEDIEKALEVTKKKDVTLLHCITSYPAPEEDYNLKLIPNLKNILGVEVGLSDHSLDPILVPCLSVLLGATIIEKHICLSNKTHGLDDPVALNSENFKVMCKAIRKYEKMKQSDGFRELKLIYGNSRIEKILGTGIKELAESEKQNYGRTNRSLHALTELKKGTIITEKNTAILRTEKVLKPGLLPHIASEIYGSKLNRDIPSGEGINLSDII